MTNVPLRVNVLLTDRLPPVVFVKAPPASMVSAVTPLLAAPVSEGYLGLPVGMIAVSAVPGMGPAPAFQFAAVFQSVLVPPPQV